MHTLLLILFTVHTQTLCYFLQCVSPYVGDGSLCVLDTDADGYPDLALSTCTDEDSAMYCSADTCRYAPNSDQTDTSPCVGDLAGAILVFENICNFCTVCTCRLSCRDRCSMGHSVAIHNSRSYCDCIMWSRLCWCVELYTSVPIYSVL